MTEGTDGTIVAQDENQEQEQEQKETQSRDFDTEAREMGWVPKDDFRGDPDKWVEAEKYVERGDTFIPFLQAERRKLKEEIDKKDTDFAKRIHRMEKSQQRRDEAQKKAYDRRVDEVKAAQTKAFNEGDEEAFHRLDKERDDLQKEAQSDKGQNDEEIQNAWIADNTWYGDNFEMAQEADNYSQFIARKNPAMPMNENLEKVDHHMRDKFSDYFGIDKPKPKPTAKNVVDGGSSFQSPGSKKSQNGYSNLPVEAKEMCSRDMADGLFKTKDEWTKAYYNDG